ncbi:MAG: SPOR domain-containing protein [Bacillota bacterium]
MRWNMRLTVLIPLIAGAAFFARIPVYAQPTVLYAPFWVDNDAFYYLSGDGTAPGTLYYYQGGRSAGFSADRIRLYKSHSGQKGVYIDRNKIWLADDLRKIQEARVIWELKDAGSGIMDLRWSPDDSALYYIWQTGQNYQLAVLYQDLTKQETIYTFPQTGGGQLLFLFSRRGDKLVYSDKSGTAGEPWGNVCLYDILTRKSYQLVKESVEKVYFTTDQLIMLVKKGSYYYLVLDADFRLYRVLPGSADMIDDQSPDYLPGKGGLEYDFYGAAPAGPQKIIGWNAQGLVMFRTDTGESHLILKENVTEMPVTGPRNQLLYKNAKGVNLLNLNSLQSYLIAAEGDDFNWHPEGLSFIYTYRKAGSDAPALYNWTRDKSSVLFMDKAMLGRWSPEGRLLAYVSMQKNPPQLCIWDSVNRQFTAAWDLAFYRLQLASFTDYAKAQTLLEQFKTLCPSADFCIETADLKEKGIWFRVKAGRFQKKEDADAFYQQLKGIWEKAKPGGELKGDWDGQKYITRELVAMQELLWLKGEERILICADRNLLLWEMKSNQFKELVKNIAPAQKGIKSFTVSPDGNKVLFLGGGDLNLYCLDLGTGQTQLMVNKETRPQ